MSHPTPVTPTRVAELADREQQLQARLTDATTELGQHEQQVAELDVRRTEVLVSGDPADLDAITAQLVAARAAVLTTQDTIAALRGALAEVTASRQRAQWEHERDELQAEERAAADTVTSLLTHDVPAAVSALAAALLATRKAEARRANAQSRGGMLDDQLAGRNGSLRRMPTDLHEQLSANQVITDLITSGRLGSFSAAYYRDQPR